MKASNYTLTEKMVTGPYGNMMTVAALMEPVASENPSAETILYAEKVLVKAIEETNVEADEEFYTQLLAEVQDKYRYTTG